MLSLTPITLKKWDGPQLKSIYLACNGVIHFLRSPNYVEVFINLCEINLIIPILGYISLINRTKWPTGKAKKVEASKVDHVHLVAHWDTCYDDMDEPYTYFRWAELRFMWWQLMIDYPHESFDNHRSQEIAFRWAVMTSRIVRQYVSIKFHASKITTIFYICRKNETRTR